ncbi:DUF6266 family protein [Pedobacter gandavensis]|uniref:DUF6266 family protein n=1 Tax=Pedobacter gandavensis TaxID=2679963 RepID=UPI00292F9D45|nr:DUF6266 family protein [Pedobacter gandavensis]
MGRLFAGPWMDVRGKVGNNVGRYVNGENIFAVKPHKSNKKPTLIQLNQQDVFGKVTSMVNGWKDLIAEGFRTGSSRQSPRNAAIEYNLEKAITGKAPNRVLDYSAFTFSRGSLPGAQNVKVINSLDDPYFLTFTWSKDSNDSEAKDTDFINFMIHCPSTGRNTKLIKVVERSALTLEMPIPFDYSGKQIECYVNFMSTDGLKVSDSQYAGSLLKV